jgi:integrase
MHAECMRKITPIGKLAEPTLVEFGPDYRADQDLIFANPDGTMLKPDSISAAVSALFKRLKIPKPKGAGLHLLRHSHTSHLLLEAESASIRPAQKTRLGPVKIVVWHVFGWRVL